MCLLAEPFDRLIHSHQEELFRSLFATVAVRGSNQLFIVGRIRRDNGGGNRYPLTSILLHRTPRNVDGSGLDNLDGELQLGEPVPAGGGKRVTLAIVPNHRKSLASEHLLYAFPEAIPKAERRLPVSQATHGDAQIHGHSLGIRERAGAAVAQRLVVVGEPRCDRILADSPHRLADEIGEGGQGDELAGGEKVAEGGKAVVRWREPTRIFRLCEFRPPSRACPPRRLHMLGCRIQVDPLAVPLGDDSHEPSSHSAGATLRLDVGRGERHFRHQTSEVRPTRQLRTTLCCGSVPWRAHSDLETVVAIPNHGLDMSLLPLLGRQHKS